MSKGVMMPQQPVTLELTAAIKAFKTAFENQPRWGRGGEILKTNEERKTIRLVGFPLPDGVFC